MPLNALDERQRPHAASPYARVSTGANTRDSLIEPAKIEQELAGEPLTTDASIDIVPGTIEIGVFLATQARQRELDARYGPGLVSLAGAFEPID